MGQVESLVNPADKSKKRFETVYSKLGVWGLQTVAGRRCSTVVFLDADMRGHATARFLLPARCAATG